MPADRTLRRAIIVLVFVIGALTLALTFQLLGRGTAPLPGAEPAEREVIRRFWKENLPTPNAITEVEWKPILPVSAFEFSPDGTTATNGRWVSMNQPGVVVRVTYKYDGSMGNGLIEGAYILDGSAVSLDVTAFGIRQKGGE